MELKVTTLEGKEAGSVQLSDAIFGLEPRKDIIAALRAVAAQQAPGRHPQDQGPRRDLAHRQEDVQAEGHRRCPSRLGPRAAVPRRRPCLRSGGALACHRSAEEGPRARAQACAVGQGQGRRSDRASRRPQLEAAKTKALIGHFSGLGLTNALIIDGAELHNGFAAAARNIPNIDVLPIQGINVYDILRRQKLVLTKAAVDALEARFK